MSLEVTPFLYVDGNSIGEVAIPAFQAAGKTLIPSSHFLNSTISARLSSKTTLIFRDPVHASIEVPTSGVHKLKGTHADLEFSLDNQTASLLPRNEQRQPLTIQKRWFEILGIFAHNPDRLITHDELPAYLDLFRKVHNPNHNRRELTSASATIQTIISKINRIFPETETPPIACVRNEGYIAHIEALHPRKKPKIVSGTTTNALGSLGIHGLRVRDIHRVITDTGENSLVVVNKTEEASELISAGGRLIFSIQDSSFQFDEKTLPLRPQEKNILLFLIKNRGRVLSRKSILEGAWGTEYGDLPGEALRTIDVHIGRVRQALDRINKGAGLEIIETIRKEGYFLR